MAADSRGTRRRIIDVAYALFYKEGYAHVGVDAIAAAAGVTKRTLYYHFDSKDALVAAVLALQHDLVLEQVERWVSLGAGDAIAMVDAIFADYAAWARKPGYRGSGFTRAAIEFARSPGHPARVAARRHKAAVETLLCERLEAQGAASPLALARQLMLLIEGCNALVLIRGDPAYAADAADAARRLVRERLPRRVK